VISHFFSTVASARAKPGFFTWALSAAISR
jgi:hypothetical protein